MASTKKKEVWEGLSKGTEHKLRIFDENLAITNNEIILRTIKVKIYLRLSAVQFFKRVMG